MLLPRVLISQRSSMSSTTICPRRLKIMVRANSHLQHDPSLNVPLIVHRIGRTGRSGKTGVATTFINQNCSEQIRLDLKHLLREAKQRIPPFLAAMEDPSEKYGSLTGGCSFCGGLGHRINDCPKLEQQRKQQMNSVMSSSRNAGGGGF